MAIVIVRDDGFHKDDLSNETFIPISMVTELEHGPIYLDLEANDKTEELEPYFARIAAIRIRFASFEDGRGFSLANRLRQLGYHGRLRAEGHLIADQYPLARRSGFDEVAISKDIAARQPANQWPIGHGRRLELSYQSQLQKAAG